MNKKIIIKKSGIKSIRKLKIDEFLKDIVRIYYESEFFYLESKSGELKKIWHEWIYKEFCKWSETDDIDILKYTVPTRKEILGKFNFYNKEYITSDSFEMLGEYIKDSNITEVYPK